MSVVEFGRQKVKLPSGKEVGVVDAIGFCYDLSDTDVEVLKVLIRIGPTTEDSIAKELKLSNASVNRSLNRLIAVGFVDRGRSPSSKYGRPRYMYKALQAEELMKKIERDFHECAKIFSEALVNLFQRRVQQ